MGGLPSGTRNCTARDIPCCELQITSALIPVISKYEQEPKSLNNLSRIRTHLKQRLAAIQNLSSPIEMLPMELMQPIISFVVGSAERHRVILRLSHVSQKFRTAVLSMPWLFTDADWNHWPPPLLVLWYERAQSQLLNVKLNYHAVWLLHDGREPKLKALLESYSSRWGSF